MPLKGPEVFQRREFYMTIGARYIDCTRQLLLDIGIAGSAGGTAAAVPGDQATLDFTVHGDAAGVQVRSRWIGCLWPEVGPGRIHEIGRSRRLRDRRVLGEAFIPVAGKPQLGSSFKGIEPTVDRVAPKHK